MFRKSRRKIVASIMLVLTLLFVGTLAVIYLSSYFEMRYENYQMLERQAQTYVLAGYLPGDMNGQTIPGDVAGKPFEEKPSFQLSTFYSVAVSADGQILSTDTGDREVYDEQTLQSYALKIISSGKERGVKGNLLYLVSHSPMGYTLVVFMDNTIVQERMVSLLRNTLIFGGAAMVALFFLARVLAKWIVRPLEESYQKQKQFISDAGHELKTPISVVSANAELLSREVGQNQWLTNIQYENQRMGTLVLQLLELARTENVAVQLEQVDMSHLVAGEALPFETVAFEKGLSISTAIEPKLTVLGNSAQLKQLVSILVDNAIDHCQPGGDVSVELCSEHNSVRLQVSNTGDAIPEEQRQQLFERFYRADDARTDDGHFGLGLAIAKAVVDAHKGKISVDCRDGRVIFTASVPQQR